MNKVSLMTNLTRNMYKFGFKFKKHSPEILVVTGAVGVVASAVMACKASMNLQAVLDKKKKQLAAIDHLTHPTEDSSFSAPRLSDVYLHLTAFFIREILPGQQHMQALIITSRVTESAL